jgi:hypothetical protein
MGRINVNELKLVQSKSLLDFSVKMKVYFRYVLAWFRITIDIKSTQDSKITFFRKADSNKLVVYNYLSLYISF